MPSTSGFVVGEPYTLALLGSNGRLGRLCVAAHAADPSIDNLLTHGRADGAAIKWDARHDSVDILARQLMGVDCVVNLIGVTPASSHSQSLEYSDLNEVTACTVLEAAQKAGVGRVFMASTAAVYGRPTSAVLSESAAVSPLSPYAASKVAMETQILERADAAQAAGTDVVVLRIGNVAGADALLSQIVEGMSSQTERPKLTIDQFASGFGPVRSYIGPISFYKMLCQLAQVPNLPRVLNVGQFPPVTMDGLLYAWKHRCPDDLDWAFQPAPIGAIEHVVIDTTLLAQHVPCDLGPQPEASMVDEVMRLLVVR